MVAKIFRKYLDALNEGSLEKVLSLFDDSAIVVSPLYGDIPAADFYKDLFADTSRSETTLLNMFEAMGDNNPVKTAVALHFQYKWTLKSGKIVEFECVDVFELAKDSKKFTKLKIIYDTAPIRAYFNESTVTK